MKQLSKKLVVVLVAMFVLAMVNFSQASSAAEKSFAKFRELAVSLPSGAKPVAMSLTVPIAGGQMIAGEKLGRVVDWFTRNILRKDLKGGNANEYGIILNDKERETIVKHIEAEVKAGAVLGTDNNYYKWAQGYVENNNLELVVLKNELPELERTIEGEIVKFRSFGFVVGKKLYIPEKTLGYWVNYGNQSVAIANFGKFVANKKAQSDLTLKYKGDFEKADEDAESQVKTGDVRGFHVGQSVSERRIIPLLKGNMADYKKMTALNEEELGKLATSQEIKDKGLHIYISKEALLDPKMLLLNSRVFGILARSGIPITFYVDVENRDEKNLAETVFSYLTVDVDGKKVDLSNINVVVNNARIEGENVIIDKVEESSQRVEQIIGMLSQKGKVAVVSKLAANELASIAKDKNVPIICASKPEQPNQVINFPDSILQAVNAVLSSKTGVFTLPAVMVPEKVWRIIGEQYQEFKKDLLRKTAV